VTLPGEVSRGYNILHSQDASSETKKLKKKRRKEKKERDREQRNTLDNMFTPSRPSRPLSRTFYTEAGESKAFCVYLDVSSYLLALQ
jgi:hypothetical protein